MENRYIESFILQAAGGVAGSGDHLQPAGGTSLD